ncbi:hypothetical protein OG21DRAFT_783872 [Imleria badia]|nr:hypothetical protein OG21DRAFT_783872 [Imleria badia]
MPPRENEEPDTTSSRQVHSWVTWQRTLSLISQENEESDSTTSTVLSWVTWQPDPALAPTPPSVEPTLLVPERGSPGLFGPRTPSLRDSPPNWPRENEQPDTTSPRQVDSGPWAT